MDRLLSQSLTLDKLTTALDNVAEHIKDAQALGLWPEGNTGLESERRIARFSLELPDLRQLVCDTAKEVDAKRT